MSHTTYTLTKGKTPLKITRKEFCEPYKPVREGLETLDTYFEKLATDLDEPRIIEEAMLLEHTLNKYLQNLKTKMLDRNGAMLRAFEKRKEDQEKQRLKAIEKLDVRVLPEALVDIVKSYLSAPKKKNIRRRITCQDEETGNWDKTKYIDNWIETPNDYWAEIELVAFRKIWIDKYFQEAVNTLSKLSASDLKFMGHKLFRVPIRPASKEAVRNRSSWIDAILTEMADINGGYNCFYIRPLLLTILLAGRQLQKQKGKGNVWDSKVFYPSQRC